MHLYKYACSGHRKSAVYVGIELVDEEGRHVPDEDIKLTGNIELVESIETADGNEITENCRTTVNNKVDGNFGTTVDCEKDVNCVSTEVMKGVTGARSIFGGLRLRKPDNGRKLYQGQLYDI